MSLFRGEFCMFRHEDGAHHVYDTICKNKIIYRKPEQKSILWHHLSGETITVYKRDAVGRSQKNLSVRERHLGVPFDLYEDVGSANSLLNQLKDL